MTIRIVEKHKLRSAYVIFDGKRTNAKRGKDGRLRVTFAFAGRKYATNTTESIAIVGVRADGKGTVAGTRSYRPCRMKLGHLNGAPFRL